MQYKILNPITESKNLQSPIYFGNKDTKNKFYITFTHDDSSSWTGVFSFGIGALSAVYPTKDTSKVLVLAEGAAYCVDTITRELIFTLGSSFDFIIQNEDFTYILYNKTNIAFIRQDLTTAGPTQVSFDGFKDISYTNHTITGLSYDPSVSNSSETWIPFTINTETFEVQSNNSIRNMQA